MSKAVRGIRQLMQRHIQNIKMSLPYLFAFAQASPDKVEHFVWIDALIFNFPANNAAAERDLYWLAFFTNPGKEG